MKTQQYNIRSFLLALASLALGLAMIQPAHAGYFTLTGSMNHPRDYCTATLLPDGRVLVAGGTDETNFLSSAELYDPATGKWTNTPDMASAHVATSATLLPNGKVLIAAGYTSAAELYDPTTGTWTNTTPMPSGLSDRSMATLLPNGKVLVVEGGFGVDSALYDPTDESWTTMNQTLYEHWYGSTTLLPNGQVLLVAGYAYDQSGMGHDQDIDRVEVFDPAGGTWTETGPLPDYLKAEDGNDFHTATLLPNGKVLVAGGHDYNWTAYYSNRGFAEIFAGAALYDAATGTWTNTGFMNTSRGYHSATLLTNGTVLAVGGSHYRPGGFPENLSSAEIYDPASGTWTPTGSMQSARAIFASVLLKNGLVLVVGGYDGSNAVATAELYNPASVPATTIVLQKPLVLSGGGIQLNFTNMPNANFSVLATTNLSQPLSDWTLLGNVPEISPGQFQFTDMDATNNSQRFYRVRSP